MRKGLHRREREMVHADLIKILIVLWLVLALIWLVGGVGGVAPGFEHLIVGALAIWLLR
jgi:hypothetical protein